MKTDAKRCIRFYGPKGILQKWRALVSNTVGKKGGPVLPCDQGTEKNLYFFDVVLTNTNLQALVYHWRRESGTGQTADRQRRWNDYIKFAVLGK